MKRLALVLWLLATLLLPAGPTLALTPADTPEISYTASGSVSSYAYPFRVWDDADLVVSLDGAVQILGSTYTVTGVGDISGGTVEFVTPPAADVVVDIQRMTPLSRSTDYTTGGPLKASTLNSDIDRVVTQLQDVNHVQGQHKNILDRALKFPLGDSTSSVLPGVNERKNKMLGFDVEGVPTVLTATSTGFYTVSKTPIADALPQYGADGELQATNIFGKVASLADLRATAGGTGNKSIFLEGRNVTGDGGAGVFTWDGSDLSAMVTLDAYAGIYVAPNSDLSGASGAWVRKYERLSNQYFGTGFSGLQAAFDYIAAVHGVMYVDGVVDLGASTLSISGDSFKIVRGKGESKITTTADVVIETNGSVSNAEFNGLVFESTGTSGGTVYGLLTSDEQNITNLRISNCTFTAPNIETNGIKVINQTSTIATGVVITENTFKDIGRMGVEFQDNNVDSTYRIKNLVISNNNFDQLGLSSTYGMAVSLFNEVEGSTVANNVIIGAKDIALEFGGSVRDSTMIGNVARELQSGCAGISISSLSNTIMKGITITGNTIESPNRDNFYFLYESTITGNTFTFTTTSGYVYIKNTAHSVVSGNIIRTSGNYAILAAGDYAPVPLTDNLVAGNIIDNSAAASNFATIRMTGTATSNVVTGNSIIKGTGGLYFEDTAGAVSHFTRDNVLAGNKDTGRYQLVSMPDTDYVLSDYEMFSSFLRFNGTLTAARNITVKAGYAGTFSFYNSTGFDLTFTTGSGSTVVVQPGVLVHIVSDGTNLRQDSMGHMAVGLSVTGSRGGNAALASLLTQLAKLGTIVDNTTP